MRTQKSAPGRRQIDFHAVQTDVAGCIGRTAEAAEPGDRGQLAQRNKVRNTGARRANP